MPAVFVGQSSKLFREKSKWLKRTRQGEAICLGERIRPASTLFPPAGGVWGGMRAGFGLGISDFKNSPPKFIFCGSKKRFRIFCFAKCAIVNRVVFAPPTRAHTTTNSLVKIKEKMYSNNRFKIQVFIILLYHTIIIIQVWHKRIKSARI